MTKDYLLNLKKLSHELFLSKKWLKRSYDKCCIIGIQDQYSNDELDDFENLSSRFGRSCDLLIMKIFRSIDSVELISDGTLIDVMNRAHKRGLINSIDEVRALKDLCNAIVHEYLPTELLELFSNILEQTPVLLSMIDKTLDYCKKITQKA